MTTRKLLVTLLATVAGVSLSAAAQVRNPDNDSATFFAYKPQTATAIARGLPAVGDVSPGGLYVWANPERGWVHAGHSYVYASGRFEHAANCLAYNLPKPDARYRPDRSPAA